MMSPHTNKHGNGIVTARRVILLFFGVFAASVGSAVDVFVLLRYFRPAVSMANNVFDWKMFMIGSMILFSGLALVFTGDPLRVFSLITSQWPGGRRRTDPPIDPDHPGRLLPREQWPKPDPTWRQQRKNDPGYLPPRGD